MDTLNLCCKIQDTINYIKPFLPLLNSHMVNYITHGLFEKLVPYEFKEEVNIMKTEDITSLLASCYKGQLVQEKGSEFSKYLLKSRNFYLQCNGVSLSFEELKEKFSLKGYESLRPLHLEQFMSLKKSHEVEVMSAIANAIATNIKCSHVIDIGGGKGYLSSMLTLEYKLRVVSIDASKVNSTGALKRMVKLEKVWNGIRKKVNMDIAGESSKLKIKFNVSKEKQSVEKAQPKGLMKQVTQFVTENSHLLEMVNEQYPNDLCEKLMIVGLHTCGNLSPSSLRLFVKNYEHVESLINVGCCYHLIDEEFEASQFWLDEDIINCPGFPMSNYLQKQKFTLGRNARMLTAQSLDRLVSEGEFNTEPLFYRALLEAFLEKKLEINDVPRFRVGRLANRTSNFVDYVRKGIQKMEINNIEVDDAEIEQFYKDHLLHKELIQKFFVIRLALAPIVEAVILMDRLLYLLEQGVQDAFIAQLFDPVVSPRCYAIIAFNSCK